MEQRLRARRLLSDMNFHDTELAEIIHTVTEGEIISIIQKHYGFVDKHTVNLTCLILKRFERGEVRVDSLGRGSVQQLREHEKPFACRFAPVRLHACSRS